MRAGFTHPDRALRSIPWLLLLADAVVFLMLPTTWQWSSESGVGGNWMLITLIVLGIICVCAYGLIFGERRSFTLFRLGCYLALTAGLGLMVDLVDTASPTLLSDCSPVVSWGEFT